MRASFFAAFFDKGTPLVLHNTPLLLAVAMREEEECDERALSAAAPNGMAECSKAPFGKQATTAAVSSSGRISPASDVLLPLSIEPRSEA
jgi:hypothetical protein